VEEIFRQDSYARSCEAKVTAVNERGGIVLDRTVFYPTGGGQPGDSGRLAIAGRKIKIVTAVKARRGRACGRGGQRFAKPGR